MMNELPPLSQKTVKPNSLPAILICVIITAIFRNGLIISQKASSVNDRTVRERATVDQSLLRKKFSDKEYPATHIDQSIQRFLKGEIPESGSRTRKPHSPGHDYILIQLKKKKMEKILVNHWEYPITASTFETHYPRTAQCHIPQSAQSKNPPVKIRPTCTPLLNQFLYHWLGWINAASLFAKPIIPERPRLKYRRTPNLKSK